MSFLELLKHGSLEALYRESVIHYTPKGIFAIRSRDWISFDEGSAPESEPEWFREKRNVQSNTYTGQLYNLNDDPFQARNLYGRYPEKVQEMKNLMKAIKKAGRTK
ncbi:MAG: hypothetical protein ACJ07L_11415 [Opitutales bacterium]